MADFLFYALCLSSLARPAHSAGSSTWAPSTRLHRASKPPTCRSAPRCSTGPARRRSSVRSRSTAKRTGISVFDVAAALSCIPVNIQVAAVHWELRPSDVGELKLAALENTRFDSAALWQTAREWSRRGAVVLVSEYNAPPDFATVATQSKSSTLAGGDKQTPRTERLFAHTSCLPRLPPSYQLGV